MLSRTKPNHSLDICQKLISTGFFIPGILLGLLMLASATAFAAPTSPFNAITKPATSKPDVLQTTIDPAVLSVEIKKKLAASQEQLALVPPEELSVNGNAIENDQVFMLRLNLRQLIFVYEGLLSRLGNLEHTQQQRIKQESLAAKWTGFSESSSYPFLKADRLKETIAVLNSQENRLNTLMNSITLFGMQIVNNANNFTIKLRQTDEAVEQAKENPGQQAKLIQERELLVLNNSLELARLTGFQIEKQSTQEQLLTTQVKLQLAQKQLGVIPIPVEMTQQDLNQVLKDNEIISQQLLAELKQAVAAIDLRNKVDPLKKPITGGIKVTTPLSAESEQLHALQLATDNIKLQILNKLMAYQQLKRDIWNLRWIFSKVNDSAKASEAYEKISGQQKFLAVIHDYVEQLRFQVLSLTVQSKEQELDATVSESIAMSDTSRNLYLEQTVSYTRMLEEIEAIQNLLERFRQELDNKFQAKSFSDYIDQLWLDTRNVAAEVWEFELFAVADTIEVEGHVISSERSITFGKIVEVLAILIIGYWIAVRVARLIEALAVSHLGMDVSLARIARRWMLFLEVLLLVIMSMLVVRIPLTIFAFMGGAVAIGAGFGMQNLLKNLICGLMLLFERPFRPGDVVEVGSIRGRITDIGVRSSHILDANGIETLIPNSTFIEQNVTNWTLSSKSVRIVVKIGIAYGSPVKLANKLLLEIAERHKLVLDDPAPQVLFEDFGSDSLLFGLYVWVVIKPDVSYKTIASDLRFMICKTLGENGIEIAFPQRDIHLDTRKPLEIRVLADTVADSNT